MNTRFAPPVTFAAIAARLASTKTRLGGGNLWLHGRPPAITIARNRAPLGTHVIGEPCRCPACGTSAWHIGRITAECDGCGYVMPVQDAPVTLR